MQRPHDRFFEKLDGWRKSASQGWTAQSAAVILLLALAMLALFAMQPSGSPRNAWTDLFSGRDLTSSELEQIEAALGESMLSEYRLENGRIRVPANQRGPYLSAIREAKAIPQSFHVPTDEAISNATWIEDFRQRSQRMHHALEKEARLAISALPGVIDAFVHIDVVADESLYRRTKASAVVGVKTGIDRPLDEQSFRTIQAMLLNFKSGLSPEAVTITDLTTGICFRGSMDNQLPEAIAALRKADLERTWQQKLASAISFVQDAKLTVHVRTADEARQIESIRCSVSVPRTAPADESLASKVQLEKDIRHRIQSALLPLIPHQGERVDDLIAVNVFDQASQAIDTHSRWRRLATSPNLLATILVAVAGLMTLLLMRNPRSSAASVDEPPPHLKIYEGQEPDHNELGDDATDRLHAIVAEDPHAVAESLSDFIDRAS